MARGERDGRMMGEKAEALSSIPGMIQRSIKTEREAGITMAFVCLFYPIVVAHIPDFLRSVQYPGRR